jgi:hypothetical protein
MPSRVLPRELLRGDRRAAGGARQRPEQCQEKGAREYEQQYEKAEWPHRKLEELPSMGCGRLPGGRSLSAWTSLSVPS